MSDRPFHVVKFGGTSVGSPDRVRRAVELVLRTGAHARRVVVTSAFGGVTDRLVEAIAAAEARTGEHRSIVEALRRRHLDAIEALVKGDQAEAVRETITGRLDAVEELLEGVFLLRECTPRFRDAIVSVGERLAAPVMAAAIRAADHPATDLDAATLIRTDDAFGEAAVDVEVTGDQVRAALAHVGPETIAVVTGFLGATEDSVTTTLGRSGSDYTATLLAAALEAETCIIWTDVAGVLSADPRVVPEAFPLPQLSYDEAAELAHFGAKVLHPRTMRPLARHGIPLVIKNTMAPEAAGTRIGPIRTESEGHIKAVTAVRGVALLRVVGAAVLEVPDLAQRVFAELHAARLPVSLVAQASAERSLCVAIREADAERAVRRLRAALAREIERGDVRAVETEGGAAVIAAVGDFMRQAPGLAGRMFATLGRAHVNVRAIAHGASEHVISAAIPDVAVPHALRALHETFALRRLRAHVVMVGVGTLGRRLLALLDDRAEALRAQGLHLRLVGVADSTRLALDAEGIPFREAIARLRQGRFSDVTALVHCLTASTLERLIVVDATPSASVAARHADLLRAGIAVVTPNKAATARSVEAWHAARAAAREGGAPYLYDAAVGAGLGVIPRLRDLLRTGDRVHRVEGVLSGTLSFVMARMHAGMSFSGAVRAARDAGLTEPDPRDDLTGRDVARKMALLAREMNLDADPADAEVESLIPDGWMDLSLEAFWDHLPERNDDWAGRIVQAPLHVIAHLEADGTIRVAVETVAGTPLADLQPAEVAVSFHTDRYAEAPLRVRGRGASTDITAAVLLADVARAAEAMR